MRKGINSIILFVIVFILCNSIFFCQNAFAEDNTKSDCESYALVDAETGQVLLGQKENTVMVPASTTKVMTAIIVLENSKLTDKVTVGENPERAEGTSIGLKKGDQYTVEDLLHGLLLESANDCAEALAEHVGRTRQHFIEMMNKKAHDLKLKHTKFVNPSGLWEDDNVTTNKTTSYELSLILKEALKYPDYVRISRVLNYKFPPLPGDTFEKWVNNKNELLFKKNSFYYEPTVAGKSGYTKKSEHTFTCAAQKDGRTLIVTIMKSSSKNDYFPFVKYLFDYGFNNTTNVKLYSSGEKIATYKTKDNTSVPLLTANDLYYTVNNKDFSTDVLKNKNSLKDSLKLKVNLPKNLNKVHFKKGDEVATASISVNNKDALNIDLCSGITKEKENELSSKFSNNSKTYIYITIGSLTVIFILYLFVKKSKHKKAQ